MSDETGVDHYAAVLADLRAKRNKLDEAIALLEGLQIRYPSARDRRAEASESEPVDQPGMFLGMTVVDATKKLLALKRKAMSNPEIAAAIKAGGLVMQSAEPANTVGSILTRRFAQVGDVVRVSRGTWGLREWYPHTSFRRKEEGACHDLPDRESVTQAETEPTIASTPG